MDNSANPTLHIFRREFFSHVEQSLIAADYRLVTAVKIRSEAGMELVPGRSKVELLTSSLEFQMLRERDSSLCEGTCINHLSFKN